MTTEEFKQMEALLSRLGEALGCMRYCIIPHYHHDGVYIGVYDDRGLLVKEGIYPTIENATEHLNQKTGFAINAEKGGEG